MKVEPTAKRFAWTDQEKNGVQTQATKAAEDSRTPRPLGKSGAQSTAPASWSAAVLCRFERRSLDTETNRVVSKL